ncbi:hypothetical protein ACJU26_09160 [Acidithiobacillus sp. M4-SHS-6]|uniref:hypothetical protein n=1 Tax=Acidithiobacillus sp. M4-SHS-6 TaxID=3383024 RepID=UPI0039BDFA16
MLNFLKWIFWLVVLGVAFFLSYLIWHNLATRDVRHHAAEIAGNAQLAVDDAFEAVLSAQSGIPRNLRDTLMSGSTGDPFDRKLSQYVFTGTSLSCGQIYVSRAAISGNAPDVHVMVGTHCSPRITRYLRRALAAEGLLQVWGYPGLDISTHAWNPRKQTLSGLKSPLNQNVPNIWMKDIEQLF